VLWGRVRWMCLLPSMLREGEGFERRAGMAGDDYAGRVLQAQEDAGKAQGTVTRPSLKVACSAVTGED